MFRLLRSAMSFFFFWLIIFNFTPYLALSQHQADNWIQGQWVGMNFTSGSPTLFYPSPYIYGAEFGSGSIMSDTLGNLLFYSNGVRVWNKNGDVMSNGENILPGYARTQSTAIIPKSLILNDYYLFSVSAFDSPDGIYYSIIDMDLNGGLGDVTSEKNIKLTGSDNAVEKLFLVKNHDDSGYWLITRLFDDDRYASYFVDSNGVSTNPIYSSTGIERGFFGVYGQMKVSYNKKYLVAAYNRGGYNTQTNPLYSFEICGFNDKTGKIDYMYMINMYIASGDKYSKPYGCEFSPDSKYLYLTFDNTDSLVYLKQYNMLYIEDSTAFVNSAITLADNSGWSLQLSNDGRIYSSEPSENIPNHEQYMGVINRPWMEGLNCNYIPNQIQVYPRKPKWDTPNILLDYLYRFEWEGDQCQGSPIHFLPHFVPTPDNIEWNFGELGRGTIHGTFILPISFRNPGIHTGVR